MGNNQNNTVIEYWTKSGIKVSYLFWDLKGKNRFSDPPPDHEVNFMFQKCLEEIDISSYQLSIVREFTSKYKYRFVTLHNRKIAEHIKEKQMLKFSRESYCMQVVQTVKTVESQKKMAELQLLLKRVELNEVSIKTSLLSQAQNEFLEVRGVERFLEFLDSSTKSNNSGTKTSFATQIELLKFFRYFSEKYTKEFYNYLSRVKSYPHVILKTYHPINTQIIAYSLDLLSEYSWRVQDETTLVQVLEKNRTANGMDSFLSPIIESILQSDSIVSVYHNVKFVNDLMASVLTKADKEILEQNLFHKKYPLVLQNVKIRLETMFYSIQKTTFINIYQKIFKYSVQKQNSKEEQPKIEAILQQSYRNSSTVNTNNRNSLQNLHETVIAILIKSEADRTSDLNQQFEEEEELPTYLTENDRRQFNKIIFDTLTEMQKFYKLQFYLQTTEDQNIQIQSTKAKELIDSRIVQHSLQGYFSKIKQQCQANKCTQVLNNCFKKIQFFGAKEWEELESFVYEAPEERKKRVEQFEELKLALQDKQSRIKTLIKEINELKAKNQQLIENASKSSEVNTLPLLLPPPPIFDSTLPLSEPTKGTSQSQHQLVLPSLPLPPLPILPGLGLISKEKQKQKRKPPKTLKNCNYTVVSYDKIKNSIFEEIDDSKVEINQNQLVQLFAKNQPIQTSPIKRAESLEGAYLTESRLTLSPSKETIKLLKADRQKNIEIVLIKLKIPKREMKKVLYECSGKFSSQHTLQVIEKLLPTQEEEQILNSFEGNEEDLGVSQRFLKELIEVPEYRNRIKSLIFSHVKDEIYFEIEQKIKRLKEAFISLRTNNRLKYVIQQCLAIGNYLNGQSVKGGAWGFKLQTIERLQEVKSKDKNMNGALYLIKQVWKQFNYPLFDKTELELYQYISKMPISQINHEISELQNYLNAIEKSANSKDPQNKNDKILQFCSSFRKQAQIKLQDFKQKDTELKEEYFRCAEYFCENGKALGSDQFGKKMYQCVLFVSNTEKIWKLISDKNAKFQKHKSNINLVSYLEQNQPNHQKHRQSAIDFRTGSYELEKQEDLTKTSPNMSHEKDSTDLQNRPHRISSIMDAHRPSKPLELLSEDEKMKQIQSIQQESVNKAMQTVFRRRTIRIQHINVRFSKANETHGTEVTVQGSKVEDIPFLKEVDKK